ncbi:MAG: hypothetical protein JST00_39570 [Deltaproteobacteria bacterium]|nr:hypothetical protein [Deltaproteobacteria bacterium]
MADEEQEVDVGDVDVESGASPGVPRKTAPPPLPSTTHLPPEVVAASFSTPPAAPSSASLLPASPPSSPSLPASSPPVTSSPPAAASAAPSRSPSAPVASLAPSQAPAPPAGRGPAFYGVILLVLFGLTLGVGALVASSRKSSAPAGPAAARSADPAQAAAPGPKVINMPVIDMADDDAGAAAPASSAP